MTFEHSLTVTTSASPASVWVLWSHPASWPSWDPAVESVAFEGHFAEGAAGKVVLAGGIEVPVTLEIVEPGARYLDRLTMGDLVIEVDHVVRPHGDGAEVTVSTVVHGPGADDVGSMVTADAPKALDMLAAMAEGRA